MTPTQKDIECAAKAFTETAYLDRKDKEARFAQLIAQRVAEETRGLREALEFYSFENRSTDPKENPWLINSRDFGIVAYDALRASHNGSK